MNNVLGSPREDLFGITKDFIEKLGNGTITPIQAKRFLRKEDPFAGLAMGLSDQLACWQALFDDAGITCDTSRVVIPDQQLGFDRLIVVPKGLTMNQMVKIMRTKFDMWLYTDDLDKAIIKNDRSNDKSAYAIRVSDRVEADEEYKNLSAKQIAEQGVDGITVLERLLYELMYFTETGKHLDVDNYTLCTGSRDADGSVPDVYWSPDYRKVSVYWCSPDDSADRLRTRAVVS